MSWNIENHEFKSIPIHMKLIQQKYSKTAFMNNVQILTAYTATVLEKIFRGSKIYSNFNVLSSSLFPLGLNRKKSN